MGKGKMDSRLPGIVVTGASGFIGRNFLEAAADKYRLFCLARRSQKEANLAKHANISWLQVDIGKWDTLREAVDWLNDNGGADYVLHLAAYYDFSNADNPEYERTNTLGTRNILKLAQQIGTNRFLFASSVAASKVPGRGQSLNEQSPLDAKFPYALSKRKGEEMMKEYSKWFPCTVFRQAAVFSDWCEYPPLYQFLNTWLSRKWNSRIIAGRGKSAVPYIHISDLIKMYFRVIEKSESLPRLCTYMASPNGSVSHSELFRTATRYYNGRKIKPIFLPKFLVIPGVALRQFFGYLLRRKPMERLWMTKYIDRVLTVDAAHTHSELDWMPTPRYGVRRRLLFAIERMKNHHDAWNLRNERTARRVYIRPNLIIYDAMMESREEIIAEIIRHLRTPESSTDFSDYQKLPDNVLHWYVTLLYQLTATTVRTRDRTLMRNYSQIIANRRFVEGFDVVEVCASMTATSEIISKALRSRVEGKEIDQRIYDSITLTFQMAVDEIEDSYEAIAAQSPETLEQLRETPGPVSSAGLERIVLALEDISQDALEDHLSEECRLLREKTLL
ncbi:NAD(P)-dependent oxidoreductase [bacterium]|nr:NAD(P)-dependent oxidoreductase [bacterium]